MEFNTTTVAILLVVSAVSLAAGWIIALMVGKNSIKAAKSKVKNIISDAERKAERAKQKVILQAKEEWFKQRDEQERKLKQRINQVEQAERSFTEKEKKLKRRENELSQLESNIKYKEQSVVEKKEAFENKRTAAGTYDP